MGTLLAEVLWGWTSSGEVHRGLMGEGKEEGILRLMLEFLAQGPKRRYCESEVVLMIFDFKR